MLKKLLDSLNIHPDKNQRWLLMSWFFSGLLMTYASPAINKEIISSLPAEWLAAESLVLSITGLVAGVVWQGGFRRKVINSFLWFSIIESLCGAIFGLFLCFVYYNVWLFAVVSLIYSSLITTLVLKCTMFFKSKLWIEKDREIYDNNSGIVQGIVCIIGFSVALFCMPSLKLSLFLWAICCILDDIGWIIVYIKNKEFLIEK